MDPFFIRWLGIFVFIFVGYTMAQSFRRKKAKPKYKNNIQMPGKFDNCLLNFIKGFTILPITLMVIGVIVKEKGMVIVSLVLTIIFIGMNLLLKQEYTMAYEENEDYFILTLKKTNIQVFYKNIVDWKPGINEIFILDQTKADEKYIRVNISILKPEILLRQIADKTFTDSFLSLNESNSDALDRKEELISFYLSHGYDYLIEEYLEK